MSSIPDLPLEPFYQPVGCGCLPLFLQAITLLSNADKQCLLSYRSEFEIAFKRLQELQIWLCSVPSQPNTAPGSDSPAPAQSKTQNTSPLQPPTTTASSNSLAPPAIPANASAPSDTAPPPDDIPTLAPPAPAPAPAPIPTPAPVSNAPAPIPTSAPVSDAPVPKPALAPKPAPALISDAPSPIPAPASVSDAPSPIPAPASVSDVPSYIPIASEPASVVSDTTEDSVTKLIHFLEKSKQAILDCQNAAPVIATRLGREDPRVAKIYMSQNESNMGFESFLCSISLADDYTHWEASKSYPGRLAALYKDVNVSKNRTTAYYKEYVKSCEHIIDKTTARNGVEYGVRFRFLEMEYSRCAGKPYVPNEHLGIIGIVSFATRCFLRVQYQDLPRLAEGLLSSSDLANLAEERNDWINQNLQRIKTGTLWTPPMEIDTIPAIPAETIPAETASADTPADTLPNTPLNTPPNTLPNTPQDIGLTDPPASPPSSAANASADSPVETPTDTGLTDPPASHPSAAANASADSPVETPADTPADIGLIEAPGSLPETPSETDIPATFVTRKRTLVDETVQRQSKNPRLDLDVNFSPVGNSCFPRTLDIDQNVAVNIDRYFPDPDLTISVGESRFADPNSAFAITPMGQSRFPDPNSAFTINPMGQSRFPDFDPDLAINPMGQSRFSDPNSAFTINPIGESRFPDPNSAFTINPMGESRFPDFDPNLAINPLGQSRFPDPNSAFTINPMGESRFPDFDLDVAINPVGESRFSDPDLSDFIPQAPDLSRFTINPIGESRFLGQYRDINFNPGMQTLVANIC